MIDYVSALSLRLKWLIPCSIFLAFGAFLLFGYVVLSNPSESKDIYLIPSILALLWSLITLSILSAFPHVPAKASKEIPYLERVKVSVTRFFYHLLALVFIVLSIVTLWFSIRLITIW